ncbi:MAG TPA: hypothetical protein VH482_06620 [Thermomicrobiales bacterium]
MTDDDAWGWLIAGLTLVLAGLVLLHVGDPFLSAMWGVALALSGGALAVVGTGALLRLWR